MTILLAVIEGNRAGKRDFGPAENVVDLWRIREEAKAKDKTPPIIKSPLLDDLTRIAGLYPVTFDIPEEDFASTPLDNPTRHGKVLQVTLAGPAQDELVKHVTGALEAVRGVALVTPTPQLNSVLAL